MKNYNKLILASKLLVESAKIYKLAVLDVDYAKSILLAGAVNGILEPLVRENKKIPSQKQFAISAVEFRDRMQKDKNNNEPKGGIKEFIFLSKFTYNSLKHAGTSKHNGNKEVIKAADDLNFKADLKEEAYWVIDHAITDFIQVYYLQIEINTQFSEEFIQLLRSPWTD